MNVFHMTMVVYYYSNLTHYNSVKQIHQRVTNIKSRCFLRSYVDIFNKILQTYNTALAPLKCKASYLSETLECVVIY